MSIELSPDEIDLLLRVIASASVPGAAVMQVAAVVQKLINSKEMERKD